MNKFRHKLPKYDPSFLIAYYHLQKGHPFSYVHIFYTNFRCYIFVLYDFAMKTLLEILKCLKMHKHTTNNCADAYGIGQKSPCNFGKEKKRTQLITQDKCEGVSASHLRKGRSLFKSFNKCFDTQTHDRYTYISIEREKACLTPRTILLGTLVSK